MWLCHSGSAQAICEIQKRGPQNHGHGKCRASWTSDFPVVAFLTDPTSSKSVYRALDLHRTRPPMTIGRGGVELTPLWVGRNTNGAGGMSKFVLLTSGLLSLSSCDNAPEIWDFAPN